MVEILTQEKYDVQKKDSFKFASVASYNYQTSSYH
jgi:hypothetical protein